MDVPYNTIGEDLFRPMLGRTMAYTCGYWKDANNLDEAQDAKFDLICRKLGLKKGMTLLDIGCGWGELLLHAQKQYGAKVTGITISKEHLAYMEKYHTNLEVLEIDYRKLKGRKFDRIASVGMFEHVGPKNYTDYFKSVSNMLEEDGLHLLHTISTDKNTHHAGDAWISKYIFPGGQLPSTKQIGKSIDGVFLLEDWQNFGIYYDKTLMAWMHNFDNAWPDLKDKYGERFYRMWRFYLLICAGMFRNRRTNLWQIVLSKNGVKGGYKGIR
jgi:cyclopropane-fatty-acyl-phospholipid synthase